jgi:hypothetical protein
LPKYLHAVALVAHHDVASGVEGDAHGAEELPLHQLALCMPHTTRYTALERTIHAEKLYPMVLAVGNDEHRARLVDRDARGVL